MLVSGASLSIVPHVTLTIPMLPSVARRNMSAKLFIAIRSCGVPSSHIQSCSRSSLEKSLRSEEHTSELQSPCNLVCRLLLEKKKHKSRQKIARRQRVRLDLRIGHRVTAEMGHHDGVTNDPAHVGRHQRGRAADPYDHSSTGL